VRHESSGDTLELGVVDERVPQQRAVGELTVQVPHDRRIRFGTVC
jgi:hypothetical protein